MTATASWRPPDDAAATHPLDNPAYGALTGPHRHLALRVGRVLRYPADVSPFFALPLLPDPQDWIDAAVLAGPAGTVASAGVPLEAPPGWQPVAVIAGVQLVGAEVRPAADPEAVRLGAADVPEMLDLVARTRPGPFLPRTVELGRYLGIRRDGRLVAMAGERLHPPGWTEISAVCTDPAYRGQGLGGRLVLAVADGIRRRGEVPFLHTGADNVTAIRLYERLGFRLRRAAAFHLVRLD